MSACESVHDVHVDGTVFPAVQCSLDASHPGVHHGHVETSQGSMGVGWFSPDLGDLRALANAFVSMNREGIRASVAGDKARASELELEASTFINTLPDIQVRLLACVLGAHIAVLEGL